MPVITEAHGTCRSRFSALRRIIANERSDDAFTAGTRSEVALAAFTRCSVSAVMLGRRAHTRTARSGVVVVRRDWPTGAPDRRRAAHLSVKPSTYRRRGVV